MRTLRLRHALIPVLMLAPLVACRGENDGNGGAGGQSSTTSGKMTTSSSSSSKASSSSGSGMTTTSGMSSTDAVSSSSGMGGMGGATSSSDASSAASTTAASTTAASTTAATTAASTSASSSSGGPTTETLCGNGTDDDMDMQTDCADSDCAQSPACSTIVINEINYDIPGTDNAEFVEIYNPGPNATNLNGVSLLLVNGNATPPAVYSPSTDLSGNTIPAGGYLVVGQANVTVAPGATKVTFAGGVQNGGGPGIAAPGDAVALFDTTEHILLDAVSYEAPVLMATISGASYDLYEGPMPPPPNLVGEDDLMPDKSVVRIPNGADTANDVNDFKVTSLLTPGAANQLAEICNDMIDNDGDMAIDCADSDCAASPTCVEVCTDGVDNDGDMMIDCADTAGCPAMTPCQPNGKVCAGGLCACPGGTTEMACNDGMDNDCDGLSDCLDPNCAAAPNCGEICTDNMDNNGNSLVDCADPLCNNQSCGPNGLTCSGMAPQMCTCPGGMVESSCTDNIDNNCDGLTDCMDPMCAGMPGCMMTVGTLFFSEHVEGSSNNKALEIINKFATPFDLAANACKVEIFSNGAATVSSTVNLTGTIASNDVWVVCNVSSGATLLALCDQTAPASGTTALNFNGDDAIRLSCGATVYDIIGQIGVDPGVEWGTAPNSTLNSTIRRKCSVTMGDTNGTDAYSPVPAEWGGFAQDTFTGIGSPLCEP